MVQFGCHHLDDGHLGRRYFKRTIAVGVSLDRRREARGAGRGYSLAAQRIVAISIRSRCCCEAAARHSRRAIAV